MRRLRELVPVLVGCFRSNQLLTYASAIALQLLVALIPLAGLLLVLLGLTGSQDVWYESVRPRLSERFDAPMFIAVETAAQRAMSETSLVWLGLGLAVTFWQVSGSVRGVTGALNRILGAEERRSLIHRWALSFLLAAGVIGLVLGAVVTVAFGTHVLSFLPGGIEGLVRWVVAAALFWLTVTLLVRYAPAERRPFQWISGGSALIILAWVGLSLAFGFYARDVADFNGTFGFVAMGLVLTGYLYYSAIVFLVGVQIDELAYERTTGRDSEASRRDSRPRRGLPRRRRSRASSARACGV